MRSSIKKTFIFCPPEFQATFLFFSDEIFMDGMSTCKMGVSHEFLFAL